MKRGTEPEALKDLKESLDLKPELKPTLNAGWN
jgi:hypothetical protein